MTGITIITRIFICYVKHMLYYTYIHNICYTVVARVGDLVVGSLGSHCCAFRSVVR